jgi:long-chain acyl-CoA synthetase
MSYVCVPLYETLGENAIEFILTHADVQLVFIEGNRMARMVKALRQVHKLQAVIYWGPATAADIKVGPSPVL